MILLHLIVMYITDLRYKQITGYNNSGIINELIEIHGNAMVTSDLDIYVSFKGQEFSYCF